MANLLIGTNFYLTTMYLKDHYNCPMYSLVQNPNPTAPLLQVHEKKANFRMYVGEAPIILRIVLRWRKVHVNGEHGTFSAEESWPRIWHSVIGVVSIFPAQCNEGSFDVWLISSLKAVQNRLAYTPYIYYKSNITLLQKNCILDFTTTDYKLLYF